MVSKQNGLVLNYASKILCDNKKFIMNLVENNHFLQFASDRLKNDKEIVTIALENDCGYYFSNASKELENSEKNITVNFKNNKYVLKNILDFVSTELKDDKEFIMSIIKNNGYILKYISERLQDDKEIVMASIKSNGGPLKYASERLQEDEEIKRIITEQNVFKDELECAYEEIKKMINN